MELLSNLLENILEMNEKVIIFTQYVKMGKIIKDLISEKFKTEVLFLHGSQSRKEKTEIIWKIHVETRHNLGNQLPLINTS